MILHCCRRQQFIIILYFNTIFVYDRYVYVKHNVPTIQFILCYWTSYLLYENSKRNQQSVDSEEKTGKLVTVWASEGTSVSNKNTENVLTLDI